MSDMIKLSGMWKGLDRNQNDYLKGSVDRHQLEQLLNESQAQSFGVFCFLNVFKDADGKPDYTLHISEKRQGNRRRPDNDEDIPF